MFLSILNKINHSKLRNYHNHFIEYKKFAILTKVYTKQLASYPKETTDIDVENINKFITIADNHKKAYILFKKLNENKIITKNDYDDELIKFINIYKKDKFTDDENYKKLDLLLNKE